MLSLTVDELIAELQEVSKRGMGQVPVILFDTQNETQFEKKVTCIHDFDEKKCVLSVELDENREWDKTTAQVYEEDRIVIPLYDTHEMKLPQYNDYLARVHSSNERITPDELAVIIRNFVQAGTPVNEETIIMEIEAHFDLPGLYKMHVDGTLSEKYKQIQNSFWKRWNYINNK